jgi:hypothetical protein
MDVEQAVNLVCMGLAVAISKGEVKGDHHNVGDLLAANPDISREIRDWFYEVCLEDLRRPEMVSEVERRRTSAEDLAGHGARGFLRQELAPLTTIEMFYRSSRHTVDREMLHHPYPFTFGRDPITLDPTFGW